MPVKVIGLVLTATGLGAVGWLRAGALAGRCRDLEQLRQALGVVRACVAHAKLPAAAALARAASAGRGAVAEACAAAARLLEAGRAASAGEAWVAAFEDVRDRCFLQPQDMDVVREFCLHFGRVDAGTQLALVDDALARLELALQQARHERQTLERLYRFSGLAAAAAAALMLA